MGQKDNYRLQQVIIYFQ